MPLQDANPTPSFGGFGLKKVPPRLRRRGSEIGWELLCLMKPKPTYIITLANTVDAEIWKTIYDNSQESLKQSYQEPVFNEYIEGEKKFRNYREGSVTKGPLRGTKLIGLPAVVRDKRNAWDKVTAPLFEVLSQRLSRLGIPADRQNDHKDSTHRRG